ncbi:hypothetical protein L4D09_09640 [Photobacterium makurazakiensis]|uniref:hypothetical protein n=1 Tax=Photobacterium makurazakiensis TaxID=2910234 RepID=UPI003D0FC445
MEVCKIERSIRTMALVESREHVQAVRARFLSRYVASKPAHQSDNMVIQGNDENKKGR